MICMDVDVALSEVPVNVMPLTDDGDFKTLETAVAYNAAGMALYWHFVTTGGSYTVTQVTPTTGGAYDWAHQQQAMYSIEIPASGGASINNDTEGFGWFTGFATGVLPWRGPTICFRHATINDFMIDSPQSLIDLKDFADDGYDPSTNKVQGVVLVDTATALGAAYDAAKTAATQASVDDLPTNAELATSQAAADDATLAAIAALNNLSNAQLVAAIAAGDDATLAAIAALVIPTANQNADALLDRADGIEPASAGTERTLREAIRIILSACAGKANGLGSTTANYRDTNDTKNRISATVDADGNRTAVTLNDT